MATELFKETVHNLVDDYIELRKELLERVNKGNVKLEDVKDFNFKEYVDSYLGFITVHESEDYLDEYDEEEVAEEE